MKKIVSRRICKQLLNSLNFFYKFYFMELGISHFYFKNTNLQIKVACKTIKRKKIIITLLNYLKNLQNGFQEVQEVVTKE